MVLLSVSNLAALGGKAFLVAWIGGVPPITKRRPGRPLSRGQHIREREPGSQVDAYRKRQLITKAWVCGIILPHRKCRRGILQIQMLNYPPKPGSLESLRSSGEERAA
jgi:hypothetical protein